MEAGGKLAGCEMVPPALCACLWGGDPRQRVSDIKENVYGRNIIIQHCQNGRTTEPYQRSGSDSDPLCGGVCCCSVGDGISGEMVYEPHQQKVIR